uniref:Peroxisome proliferator-activated receptor gamma coactivator-related protein 1-like n=3 Tax=Callorhinchus milii TaxID=7868 RepID=A0A4W3IGE7_CALMI
MDATPLGNEVTLGLSVMGQSLPCVINTENVSLIDLVKYMHPYCLPNGTVWLEANNIEDCTKTRENGVEMEIQVVQDGSVNLHMPEMQFDNDQTVSELPSGQNLELEYKGMVDGQNLSRIGKNLEQEPSNILSSQENKLKTSNVISKNLAAKDIKQSTEQQDICATAQEQPRNPNRGRKKHNSIEITTDAHQCAGEPSTAHRPLTRLSLKAQNQANEMRILTEHTLQSQPPNKNQENIEQSSLPQPLLASKQQDGLSITSQESNLLVKQLEQEDPAGTREVQRRGRAGAKGKTALRRVTKDGENQQNVQKRSSLTENCLVIRRYNTRQNSTCTRLQSRSKSSIAKQKNDPEHIVKKTEITTSENTITVDSEIGPKDIKAVPSQAVLTNSDLSTIPAPSPLFCNVTDTKLIPKDQQPPEKIHKSKPISLQQYRMRLQQRQQNSRTGNYMTTQPVSERTCKASWPVVPVQSIIQGELSILPLETIGQKLTTIQAVAPHGRREASQAVQAPDSSHSTRPDSPVSHNLAKHTAGILKFGKNQSSQMPAQTPTQDAPVTLPTVQPAPIIAASVGITASPVVNRLTIHGAPAEWYLLEQPAPAQVSMAPAQVSMAPAQVSMAPARVSMAPARVSMVPAQVSMAPARVQPAPARAQPAPARAQPAPARVQPAPTQVSMAPAQVQPVPAQAPVAPPSSFNITSVSFAAASLQASKVLVNSKSASTALIQFDPVPQTLVGKSVPSEAAPVPVIQTAPVEQRLPVQTAAAHTKLVHKVTRRSSGKKNGDEREKPKGIVAPDLMSLLEQFEETEATEEMIKPLPRELLSVSTVGSTSYEEMKPLDHIFGAELASTAGLTPPATPPHQLWKSVPPVTLLGKRKVYNTAEGSPGSPLRTVKLIEPKPLSQSNSKTKCMIRVDQPFPKSPVKAHIGFGDHEYCLPANDSISRQPMYSTVSTAHTACWQGEASADVGCRWNVKRQASITIKPIASMNSRPPSCNAVKNKTKAAEEERCFTDDDVSGCQGTTDSESRQSSDFVNQIRNAEIKAEDAADVGRSGSKAAGNRSSIQKDAFCPRSNGKGTSVIHSCLQSQSVSPHRSAQTGSNQLDSHRAYSRGRTTSYRRYHRSTSSSSLDSTSWSRSRSRSPAGKQRRYYRRRSHRSRYNSRSSSCSRSYSRSSSRSLSGSRSRSRSSHRHGIQKSYDTDDSDLYENAYEQCHGHSSTHWRELAIEERRVVYIGKIRNGMMREELKRRFEVFGEIEDCNIYFREEGDNYGFVTYRYTCDAFAAIENGQTVRRPDELPFDLCFGGRRQFCKTSYADLDSNHSDYNPIPAKSKFDTLDFDTLLKQAKKNIRR